MFIFSNTTAGMALALTEIPSAEVVKPNTEEHSERVWYNIFGQVARPKRKATSVTEIKVGDHVAFIRMAYWHHGIVEKIDEENKTVHVIEYNIKVLQNKYPFEGEEALYIVEHRHPDDVPNILERAREGLNKQESYHPVFQNCEHFANYCIENKKVSEQIVQIRTNILLVSLRFLVEIVVFCCKFGALKNLATRVPILPEVRYSVVMWALIIQIILATLVEVSFMSYDIHKARKSTQPKCSNCCCDCCSQAVVIRVTVAVTSLLLMTLGSFLARWFLDINRAGTALLAGSFGCLLGYVAGAALAWVCFCQNRNDSTHIQTVS